MGARKKAETPKRKPSALRTSWLFLMSTVSAGALFAAGALKPQPAQRPSGVVWYDEAGAKHYVEGRSLAEADYSAIEQRALAHYAAGTVSVHGAHTGRLK